MTLNDEDMRRVVESALGSLRAEGLEPSPEVLAAADDLVAGHISMAGFVALILQTVSDHRTGEVKQSDLDVTSVLNRGLRDQVAYDIWSHTDAKAKDVHCPSCGTYEPCEPCMSDIYRPAANAVLATVRRAIVLHHNGGTQAGERHSEMF